MEERINNQKIFSYVPSLVAKLILDSDLQDKDIFTIGEKSSSTKRNRKRSTINFISATSVSINSNMFPISHTLDNTIIMNIKLKGFQKLISHLSFKDPEDLKEKCFSEYLSLITPKILLKISDIIEKNGGEIVKYNDYEFTTIWSFSQKKEKQKMQRFKKFYAKYAIITAVEIMKYVDETEIACGVNVKISIGIAMGKVKIVFFGGERKRSECVVMGEAIEKSEKCLNYSLSHEIIISKEMNDLFNGSFEITTKQLGNDNDEELGELFSLNEYNEELLNNFIGFTGMKMKYVKINMSKEVYDNLANKVYLFSSILPQGLLKYFDVGEEQNLKEISVVTIATIHIYLNRQEFKDLNHLQKLILDIQKATYLTFGSLLYMSKTYNGLLVRCVWGMDPGSFLDDTARSITTGLILGKLTESYDIKVGIGITTGSCYTGLIPLQGNRKQFTLLGKKVNLSRTLADEAFQKVLENKNGKLYIIYCDKLTMQQSQKWYRHIYISQIKLYFNQDSDLCYETNDDFYYKIKKLKSIENNSQKVSFSLSQKDMNSKLKKINTNNRARSRGRKDRMGVNNSHNINNYGILKLSSIKFDYNVYLTDENNKISDVDDSCAIVTEIYSPIQNEEYFLPKKYDPFPLIRTHLNNCYSPNNKYYITNHIENYGNNNIEVDLNLIYPKSNNNNNSISSSSINEKKKIAEIDAYIDLVKIYQKSITTFGFWKELEIIVKILNDVTKKNEKQFMLIKGPLGIGKSLLVRKALNNFFSGNEELTRILYEEEEFVFCNVLNPLLVLLPYNTISFVLRKIFLHLKRLKKIQELYKLFENLSLDSEDLKNISFVLSIGKSDINLENEFEKTIPNFHEILIKKEGLMNKIHIDSAFIKHTSVVAELEGPFKFHDTNKLNSFFYEMVLIYKEYLNSKQKDCSIPLILVFDDIHSSDQLSIDFLKYVFNNNEKKLNPFIVILIEQTPYNVNYRPLKHRVLEVFLTLYEENTFEVDKDKILTFDLQPIQEKVIIKKVLLSYFIETIFHMYKSGFESIDDKILDFLIMKSFNGVPLLYITLFDSLLRSNKFIKKEGANFVISNDLIEDNNLFDWSDLLLPYVYEKIASMTINSVLNFKETLLLKYACTIGTLFDIQTLNKINPLNVYMTTEDLENIMFKLNNFYLIELYNDFYGKKRLGKKLVCKMCFPLMREALHQKFPIVKRSECHRTIAEFLSTSNQIANYYSTENEVKILKRHLIYSETNVTEEIEAKGKIDDSILNRKISNYNNLKFLVVKELCSKFFYNNQSKIFEGNIEILFKARWKKYSYFINRRCKIYINEINEKNKMDDPEFELPINDIYKSTLLKKGDKFKTYDMLEICLSENSNSYHILKKKILYLRAEQQEEICKLDIALNFLRVKVNYDKYVYTYGQSKFPLYKLSWYDRKEKKYYMHIEEKRVIIYNKYHNKRQTKSFSSYLTGASNLIDKLIKESKHYKKYFTILMSTVLSVFLGCIQENLNFSNNMDNSMSYSGSEESEESEKSEVGSPLISKQQIKITQNFYFYRFYFTTPKHVKFALSIYFRELKERYKNRDSFSSPEQPKYQRASVFLPSIDKKGQFEFRNALIKSLSPNKSSKSLKRILLMNIKEKDESEKNEDDSKSYIEDDEVEKNSSEKNNNDTISKDESVKSDSNQSNENKSSSSNKNSLMNDSNDQNINTNNFNISNYINNNININVINNEYGKSKTKIENDDYSINILNTKNKINCNDNIENSKLIRLKTTVPKDVIGSNNTQFKNHNKSDKKYLLENNNYRKISEDEEENSLDEKELEEKESSNIQKLNSKNYNFAKIISLKKNNAFYKALNAILGVEDGEENLRIEKYNSQNIISKDDKIKKRKGKNLSAKKRKSAKKVKFDENSYFYIFQKPVSGSKYSDDAKIWYHQEKVV